MDRTGNRSYCSTGGPTRLTSLPGFGFSDTSLTRNGVDTVALPAPLMTEAPGVPKFRSARGRHP